jgi:hypothetical protein
MIWARLVVAYAKWLLNHPWTHQYNFTNFIWLQSLFSYNKINSLISIWSTTLFISSNINIFIKRISIIFSNVIHYISIIQFLIWFLIWFETWFMFDLLRNIRNVIWKDINDFDVEELIEAESFLGSFVFCLFNPLVVFVCMDVFPPMINGSFNRIRENLNRNPQEMIYSFSICRFHFSIGWEEVG